MPDPTVSNATLWDITKWIFGGALGILSWLFRGHDTRIGELEHNVNNLKQTRITFDEADKRRLDLKADIYTKMVEIQSSGERGRMDLREDVNKKIDTLSETVNTRFDDLRELVLGSRREARNNRREEGT